MIVVGFLRNDKEVVLLAVQQAGSALVSASKALRNNREVVLAAVLQDGTSLYFASDELQSDVELCRVHREATLVAVEVRPLPSPNSSPVLLLILQPGRTICSPALTGLCALAVDRCSLRSEMRRHRRCCPRRCTATGRRCCRKAWRIRTHCKSCGANSHCSHSILPHPPLILLDISIWMKRKRQQNIRVRTFPL